MDQPNTVQPAALANVTRQIETYARRKPGKTLLSAFGAGFLLNLLPLGAIVAALAAIAFSLIRPALLLLGLMKGYELCRHQTPTTHE